LIGIAGIDVMWKLWGAIGVFIADRQRLSKVAFSSSEETV
jgi:hypothetical protein